MALLLYSYLNAIMGSTFIARRAGRKHASRETLTKAMAIRMRVKGSLGLTP
jgi:hypothetical protein